MVDSPGEVCSGDRLRDRALNRCGLPVRRNRDRKCRSRCRHDQKFDVGEAEGNGVCSESAGFDFQKPRRPKRPHLAQPHLPFRPAARSRHHDPSCATPLRPARARSRSHKAAPLIGLIGADLGIDFFSMGPHIGPCIRQILGAQSWVSSEQRLLARAEAAGMFEQPNWYARAHDARLSAAYVGALVDSREVIAKFLHYPFKNLGLLSSGEFRQYFFEIAQTGHSLAPATFIVANELAQQTGRKKH